jgi:hypothetical protein
MAEDSVRVADFDVSFRLSRRRVLPTLELSERTQVSQMDTQIDVTA